MPHYFLGRCGDFLESCGYLVLCGPWNLPSPCLCMLSSTQGYFYSRLLQVVGGLMVNPWSGDSVSQRRWEESNLLKPGTLCLSLFYMRLMFFMHCPCSNKVIWKDGWTGDESTEPQRLINRISKEMDVSITFTLNDTSKDQKTTACNTKGYKNKIKNTVKILTTSASIISSS